jgi:hypothetical protein
VLTNNSLSASRLSNADLESTLRAKATQERKLSLEIIELLEEMDRRKLYLERGYSSLIEYCVKELKYSEGSAYRRISAMRVVRDVPETKNLIQEGSLNLVTVAKAHTLFRAEAKADHAYAKDDKKKLLEQLKNQSGREVEKVIAALSPETALPKEKVRAVAASKTQVTLVVGEDLMQKLEKLKNLLSHKSESGTYAELIEQLADFALKKLDPSVKMQENPRAAQPPVKSLRIANKRYIPAATRREVWRKSDAQCCYQDPQTGQRCSAKKYLEFDHIAPHSHGGKSDEENLQLLCDAHNRWKGARRVRKSVQNRPQDGF